MSPGGDSVFEVGCGAGANLYLFAREGITVGGMDYAAQLVDIMEKMIPTDMLLESIAGEASELPCDVQYDAVMAGGVFKYFSSFAYAKCVLGKMFAKTKNAIGLLRNPDKDFLNWKRSEVKDYEERYKDLPELYIPREFFSDWAKENGMRIEFTHHHIEGAWNDPYTFDCFMYK